jgi:phosphoribosylformylglycinamidine synthase
MGADVDISAWQSLSTRGLLFGETQGRVIVSSAKADAVLAIAKKHGVPAQIIGTVTAAAQGLHINTGPSALSISAERMITAYHEALPRAMSRAAAEAVTADPALAGAH